MYTPRVGENTVYDSPVLSPRAPPTPLSWPPSTFPHGSESNSSGAAGKQAVQTDFQPALNFKCVWGNLNIEGNLERTEAALGGPRRLSLCVVLMSTFVPTVAFQIHANRRPVLCVALYRWSPL